MPEPPSPPARSVVSTAAIALHRVGVSVRRTIGALVIFLSGLSRAEDAAMEWLDEYRVPAACPAESAFAADVATRAAVSLSDVSERVCVAIESTGDAHVGSVTFSDGTSRQVEATDCAKVAEALAFITAVRLRERAPVGPALGAFPLPPSAPPVPPVSPPVPPRPVAPSEPVVPTVVAARSPRRTVEWGGGATAVLGSAPAPLFGVTAGVGLVGVRHRWAFRATAERLSTGPVQTHPGRAEFTLTAARLGVCFGAAQWRSLSVLPCLQVGSGMQRARGIPTARVPVVESVDRPWVTAGMGVRAGVQLSARWAVYWDLAAPFSVTRQELHVDQPKVVIHETWFVIPWTSLTLQFLVEPAWGSDADPQRARPTSLRAATRGRRP